MTPTADRFAALERSARALGVPAPELRWLIECELQLALLQAGRRASARVWLDPVPGYRIDADRGPAQTGPLEDVLDGRCMRAVLRRCTGAGRPTPSALAVARCIAVRGSFTELRLREPQRSAGDSVVLPHHRLAALDAAAWPPRGEFYVRAGAPADAGVARPGDARGDAPSTVRLACRDDSAFLRLLCRQVLGVQAGAELYRGAGVIIMDARADIGRVIGTGGSSVRQLQALAGLKHLFVVRRPAAAGADGLPARAAEERRLGAALHSFGIRRWRLTAPRDGQRTWTVHAAPVEARRILGPGGTKLMFISRLAGLPLAVCDEAPR